MKTLNLFPDAPTSSRRNMRETPQKNLQNILWNFGNNAHLKESVVVFLSLYIRNGTTCGKQRCITMKFWFIWLRLSKAYTYVVSVVMTLTATLSLVKSLCGTVHMRQIITCTCNKYSLVPSATCAALCGFWYMFCSKMVCTIKKTTRLDVSTKKALVNRLFDTNPH